jgi:hypothetical protein
MFDDNDPRPLRVMGRVQLEIAEDENGDWVCRVFKPQIKTSDVRKIYKMALITADVQVHVKDRLKLIDRMIMNNAEIAQYQQLQRSEGLDKPTADVDKYQTKLPFKEGY